MLTRRDFSLGAGAFAMAAACAHATAPADRSTSLILAPSNLGLRPNESNREPGTWRAPAALMAAGLQTRVGAGEVMALERPPYAVDAQPGTRIRNGRTLRLFSLELARAVHGSIAGGHFPIVVGGDCSILLGCLYGTQQAGGRGLVHVDGHSDFFHPGNYDSATRLGAVAGMDLALATGRGEALLAEWPELDGPLARDEDTIQIGERNAMDPNFDQFYGDVARTGITRMIVQDVLRRGIAATTRAVLDRLEARRLDRAWLHVDLDILDQAVMPAVDSPGSPGLDFDQLGMLLGGLLDSGRFVGTAIAIYDPERDPQALHAAGIVNMLGCVFGRAGGSPRHS